MVLFDIFIVIQPDPTREANAATMAFENNRKVFIRFNCIHCTGEVLKS